MCVPCECSPKSTLTKEDLNNSVDGVTHSVASGHPLSSSIPVSLNGCINKVVVVSGMEVMCGPNYINIHSLRPTWLWPLQSAAPVSNRPPLSP